MYPGRTITRPEEVWEAAVSWCEMTESLISGICNKDGERRREMGTLGGAGGSVALRPAQAKSRSRPRALASASLALPAGPLTLAFGHKVRPRWASLLQSQTTAGKGSALQRACCAAEQEEPKRLNTARQARRKQHPSPPEQNQEWRWENGNPTSRSACNASSVPFSLSKKSV